MVPDNKHLPYGASEAQSRTQHMPENIPGQTTPLHRDTSDLDAAAREIQEEPGIQAPDPEFLS